MECIEKLRANIVNSINYPSNYSSKCLIYAKFSKSVNEISADNIEVIDIMSENDIPCISFPCGIMYINHFTNGDYVSEIYYITDISQHLSITIYNQVKYSEFSFDNNYKFIELLGNNPNFVIDRDVGVIIKLFKLMGFHFNMKKQYDLVANRIIHN